MLVWLMIIAGIVFLDQLSKWLTVINLDLYETFPIIKDVFHFTYVRNTGAAFSIFNEPDQRWIFMTVSSVAIVLMFIYLYRNRKGSRGLNVAMAFIIGGGIGNMVDRCILKYVIDFIDFRIIHFPIFNIADSFVCVGVGLFVLFTVLEEVKNMKEQKALKLAAEAAHTEDEKEDT